MAKRNFRLHNPVSGAAITVSVTTRASQNEISEILDDGTIKIRLTSAPSDTSANPALLEFLASILEIHITELEIVPGMPGKDKLVVITNMDANAVQQKILRHLN